MRIEKMKPEEIEEVSRITAQAFVSKFSGKIGLSQEELGIIIANVWFKEADNLGLNVWTVKHNDTIVGAYGLSEKTRTRITLSMLGKLTGIIRHLGLVRFFLFLKVLLETNHKLATDELYIDFVTVKERNRNQNIGHFIMQSIGAYAEEKEGIGTVSLFVLKDNNRARHLYEKFGFKKSQRVNLPKYDFLVQTID